MSKTKKNKSNRNDPWWTYKPKEHNEYLQAAADRMKLAKHKMLLLMNGLKSFWASASSEAQILIPRVAAERFMPYFLLSMQFRNILVPGP